MGGMNQKVNTENLENSLRRAWNLPISKTNKKVCKYQFDRIGFLKCQKYKIDIILNTNFLRHSKTKTVFSAKDQSLHVIFDTPLSAFRALKFLRKNYSLALHPLTLEVKKSHLIFSYKNNKWKK